MRNDRLLGDLRGLVGIFGLLGSWGFWDLRAFCLRLGSYKVVWGFFGLGIGILRSLWDIRAYR